MKIEGAKLVSVLQTGLPAEGREQAHIDNEAMLDGFADALQGQMGMGASGESKVQSEASRPYKNELESQQTNSLSVHTVLPRAEDNQEQSAVFGAKSLPATSNELPKPGSVDKTTGLAASAAAAKEEVGLKAALATVAEVLGYTGKESGKGSESHLNTENPVGKAPGSKKADSDRSVSAAIVRIPMPQHSDQVREDIDQNHGITKDADVISHMRASLPGFAKGACPKIGEAATLAHADVKKSSRRGQGLESENADQDLTLSLSIANMLPPIPTLMMAEENINNLTDYGAELKNGTQATIKPFFEEIKSTVPTATDALDDSSPQKNIMFGQMAKEFQNLNENRSESSLHAGASVELSEAGVSVSDIDKAAQRGIADIAELNRKFAENKVEIPAMTKPLAHPDWNKDLGERIIWMNNKELSAAEIKLNPEHLGPISIRIEMNNDQATIAFTAQHAAVRDALEASIPKLRELMSSQQLNLGDVNISQNQNASSGQQHHSTSQQSPRHFDDFPQMPGIRAELGDELEHGVAVVSKGILSIYA